MAKEIEKLTQGNAVPGMPIFLISAMNSDLGNRYTLQAHGPNWYAVSKEPSREIKILDMSKWGLFEDTYPGIGQRKND